MAIINVSLDTDSREFTINMDGQPMTNFQSVFIEVFNNLDGGRDIFLSIEEEVPLENGLVITRRMRLATPEEQEKNNNSLVIEEGSKHEFGARAAIAIFEATRRNKKKNE